MAKNGCWLLLVQTILILLFANIRTVWIENTKQVHRIGINSQSTFTDLLEIVAERINKKGIVKVTATQLSILVTLEDDEEAELDPRDIISENIQENEKNKLVVRLK